jgi:outer membrane protein TolC
MFTVFIYVSVGNTGSDRVLSNSYRNLQSREVASLGIKIPILDWGKGRGGVKLAESEQEVAKRELDQSRLDFE